MGLPNVLNTGRSGMMATKAAIATAGHNISNATTEGFSRQRVGTEALMPRNDMGKLAIGQGTNISRVSRVNDQYIEKQLRVANRDLSNLEEKDLMLRQVEDIFNEMGGEGLNRMIARFFNEFRKLGNEPHSEAARQSVREATVAMANDFRRLRAAVEDVRMLVDSRLEGYVKEANSLATEIKDLNIRIKSTSLSGVEPNDLMDKRDLALKNLAGLMDLNMHQDSEGNYLVDIKGIGPLVQGVATESFYVSRSPADEQGKPENAYDIRSTAAASSVVTHTLKGGKFGALLEVRDKTLSMVLDRLDELAYGITSSVNDLHGQGFTKDGVQGVQYFKPVGEKHRAAEFIDLSEAVKDNVNNIAAAAMPDAPGDNRVAIAISAIQSDRIMNGGQVTVDDWFNSIVSTVGVLSGRNRNSLNQQKDIMGQLTKMRDQLSGVSIDEETANIMQFHQAYGASAKVIQVADEMLKTILDLKR